MPSFNIMTEITFEAYCTCGNRMCRNVKTDDDNQIITITPCEDCLAEAENYGYRKGQEEYEIDESSVPDELFEEILFSKTFICDKCRETLIIEPIKDGYCVKMCSCKNKPSAKKFEKYLELCEHHEINS